MFSQGLESLLRKESHFDIVGREKDMGQALEQIKALQPDVVIVDTDNSHPGVTPILRANPGVKVISLSLQNNDLYIYGAKQWVARGTKDLVEAIEDNLSFPETIRPKASSGDRGNRLSEHIWIN